MQKCTSCGAAPASIHVVELSNGTIENDQWLCESCGVNQGHVHGSSPASPDVLSSLLSMGQLVDVKRREPRPGTVCPGCRMSAVDFRQTGRFGCPRCYEVFREPLLPVLHKVHDATTHSGRFPGPRTRGAKHPRDLVDLRRRLDEAVSAEDYEQAARLRDELQKFTGGFSDSEGKG